MIDRSTLEPRRVNSRQTIGSAHGKWPTMTVPQGYAPRPLSFLSFQLIPMSGFHGSERSGYPSEVSRSGLFIELRVHLL